MTNAELFNEADYLKKVREIIEKLKKSKVVGNGPKLYYDSEDDTCKPIPK